MYIIDDVAHHFKSMRYIGRQIQEATTSKLPLSYFEYKLTNKHFSYWMLDRFPHAKAFFFFFRKINTVY